MSCGDMCSMNINLLATNLPALSPGTLWQKKLDSDFAHRAGSSTFCVKITISTHGYDTVHRYAERTFDVRTTSTNRSRAPLIVHVGETSVKRICDDGKVMRLS